MYTFLILKEDEDIKYIFFIDFYKLKMKETRSLIDKRNMIVNF